MTWSTWLLLQLIIRMKAAMGVICTNMNHKWLQHTLQQVHIINLYHSAYQQEYSNNLSKIFMYSQLESNRSLCQCISFRIHSLVYFLLIHFSLFHEYICQKYEQMFLIFSSYIFNLCKLTRTLQLLTFNNLMGTETPRNLIYLP